jgi:hypothetical protein
MYQSTSGDFGCQADLQLSLDGGGTWITYPGIPAACHLTSRLYLLGLSDYCVWPRTGGGAVSYTVTLDQLDIAGGGLPAGVTFRESPTLSSEGVAMKSSISPSQREFSGDIAVMLEASLDGGVSWFPASTSCETSLDPAASTPARTTTWGQLKTIYR